MSKQEFIKFFEFVKKRTGYTPLVSPDTFKQKIFQKIIRRKFAILAWDSGALSFRDLFFLLMPYKLAPKSTNIKDKLSRYLNI
jgi:hypothetical protein